MLIKIQLLGAYSKEIIKKRVVLMNLFTKAIEKFFKRLQ